MSPSPHLDDPLLHRWAPAVARLHTPGLQAWALSRGGTLLPDGALEAKLGLGRPLRIKLGLDPTAPDIHLGHLVMLERLREFQDAGHQVVLIVGDFTARIGDPSGRSKTRRPLSEREIEAAAASYSDQVFTVLDRQRTEVHRNSEWLEGMSLGELFRLAASATLAQLLARDDFAKRQREAQPLTMLEMLYPLIQGFDSVAVRADVELGGTDQTFNLLLGRDIQRHFGMPEQAALTLPLLVGLDGAVKMSKTVGNTIALDERPDEAFAKTMSLPDAAMPSWFALLFAAAPSPGLAAITRKRLLARSVAERVGGTGAGARAEAAFDRVHLHRLPPADAAELDLPDGELIHLPAPTGQRVRWQSRPGATQPTRRGCAPGGGGAAGDLGHGGLRSAGPGSAIGQTPFRAPALASAVADERRSHRAKDASFVAYRFESRHMPVALIVVVVLAVAVLGALAAFAFSARRGGALAGAIIRGLLGNALGRRLGARLARGAAGGGGPPLKAYGR